MAKRIIYLTIAALVLSLAAPSMVQATQSAACNGGSATCGNGKTLDCPASGGPTCADGETCICECIRNQGNNTYYSVNKCKKTTVPGIIDEEFEVIE